jgi:hypothetical protein
MKSDSHFYLPDGKGGATAFYETPYADPSKGMRKTTLADAKKKNALPSVTTITKVLAAPALIEWLRQTAAIAAVTTPRNPGEDLDSFVARALAVDAESIGDAAKQLGSDIHDAIEKALNGKEWNGDLIHAVSPTLAVVQASGYVAATEKILVGDCYAGKTDCITENDTTITVDDFKTTGAKKLPIKSYPEHRLQLSAYAAALGNTGTKRIITRNIYISTIRPGEISVCHNPDWQQDFSIFQMVCKIWQWQNNFIPKHNQAEATENHDVPMP